MGIHLYVKCYDDISAQDRNEIFSVVRQKPGVEFVCDLTSLTRETLDALMMPRSQPIKDRLKPKQQEPAPIRRPRSLRERIAS